MYKPLFNALIFLYNTIGSQNLGLAVIWLTIAIRLVLVPLTFIEEKNKAKYQRIDDKWKELERDVPSDLVLRREMMKKYIRQQHASPWAKMTSLGVQLLVLVLLYQVFISGFKIPHPEALYTWVQQPSSIQTSFFGLFDVSVRNAVMSLVVAVYLYISVWYEQKETKGALTRAQLWYRIFFPLFTFVALYILPSVKALFILTSMLFSTVFHQVKLMLDKNKKGRSAEKAASEPVVLTSIEGANPWEGLKK